MERAYGAIHRLRHPAVSATGELPPPPIEVRGLVKRYPGKGRETSVVALDGIDLSVREGEVVGLLGPNGAGKSTLLKILLGLLPPEAGIVRRWGKTECDAGTRARIGYLPEGDDFAGSATIAETVRDFALLSGWRGTAAREAAERALVTVDLQDVGNRRVEACSRGMRRRLGLAAAMVGEPDLLVLDEPTAGLDPRGAAEFGEWIGEWKQRGRSVLFCSHHLPQVERLCDAIVILDRGRVLRAGTVAELLADSRHLRLEVSLRDSAQRLALDAWLRTQGLDAEPSQARSLEALYLDLLGASQARAETGTPNHDSR